MLKSAKKAATSAILITAGFAVLAAPAFCFEQPRFDKKIEMAAREIVAKKVGDIRGSVVLDEWVAEQGVDEMMTGPVPVDETAMKANVQLANLIVPQPSIARPMPTRTVRKISSFIFY
jgi:hypothetical protein